MIQNTQELNATLARIWHFQKQIEKLRKVETNPHNYRLSAGGFLAEIDRMNLEVREYLLVYPSELRKQMLKAAEKNKQNQSASSVKYAKIRDLRRTRPNAICIQTSRKSTPQVIRTLEKKT
ncbi:MAG: hypothetical protein OXI24_12775 [Candidatus Poribacteria bacterium]|nr:hypothetical protein [Candidatus Poribacteria bacterium]